MPLRRINRLITSKLLFFQQSETKFFWILAALFCLIVFHPILPSQGWGGFLLGSLLAFVVLSGIIAANNERQIMRQLIGIGALSLVLDWLATFSPQFPILTSIAFALYGLFINIVTVVIIIQVMKSTKVTANVISGAIAGYLLIGISGTFLAALLESLDPGAFMTGGQPLEPATQLSSLMYYSLVTLSTIGYGDITPTTAAARSLSLLLGLSGQIYLTVLIAMLIGKYLNERQ